ncbi:MAG: LD-carboxypeptidase [Turicibacter sp.]|nr:LD-carboxypeptidase [Turicibacter sp.]
MLKPQPLKKGDKIAIISLSRGLIGEPFMSHQRELIENRLQAFGLEFTYTPHALKGIEYISNHPDKRADDLVWAFKNPEIKGILCAIGGEDTYRTIPYLLQNDEFAKLVLDNPKLFMGYSDTTINHLMFHKLGLSTLYGLSAIVDFGELDNEMLPYTASWFEKLYQPQTDLEIAPGDIWYTERTDFSMNAMGTPRTKMLETRGIEVLHGTGIIEGTILGGCLESLGELILGDNGDFSDEKEINETYGLFPKKDGWKGKILILETSEGKSHPTRVKELLAAIESEGVFEAINGIMVGKPQDEAYYDEYKEIYAALGKKYGLPIFYNLNFGHAHPKCILPIGGLVRLDCDKKKVTLPHGLVG